MWYYLLIGAIAVGLALNFILRSPEYKRMIDQYRNKIS